MTANIRDYDDPVNVVRHHNERVQSDLREMLRYRPPTLLDGPAHNVQQHLPIHHPTEKAFPAVGA